MTVSENLLLASLRGEKRRFSLRKLKENRDVFINYVKESAMD